MPDNNILKNYIIFTCAYWVYVVHFKKYLFVCYCCCVACPLRESLKRVKVKVEKSISKYLLEYYITNIKFIFTSSRNHHHLVF